MIVLVLPETYPYIVAGLAANFLLCQFCMPLIGMRARLSTFTKEFIGQFEEEHRQHYPESKPDPMGNPDQGTGWYAQKLPLKDWVRFQSAQRIIMNQIEFFPTLIICSLLCGLLYPIFAIVGVWGVFVARIIYIVGYKMAPKLRVLGFLPIFLLTNMMIILSFVSAIQLFWFTGSD